MTTFYLSGGTSNSVFIISKNCSEQLIQATFRNSAIRYSIHLYLHSNLDTLLPFYMRKNGIFAEHEHTNFHFGTCYTKLLHQMSFHSPPNSAINHCFQTQKNLFVFAAFLFSWNLGAFKYDQVTVPSLPT